jgi:hypothetical protein
MTIYDFFDGCIMYVRKIEGRSQPPKLEGQIERKSFGGAKIKKKNNNKICGKNLIFFLGRTLGLGGGLPRNRVFCMYFIFLL